MLSILNSLEICEVIGRIVTWTSQATRLFTFLPCKLYGCGTKGRRPVILPSVYLQVSNHLSRSKSAPMLRLDFGPMYMLIGGKCNAALPTTTRTSILLGVCSRQTAVGESPRNRSVHGGLPAMNFRNRYPNAENKEKCHPVDLVGLGHDGRR